MSRPTLAIVPFVLFSSLAAVPAQTIVLRGELGDGRATGCYYCPNVPFAIKHSETPVRSTIVNLAQYADTGTQLEFTGVWNTATVPPGLDVTAVRVIQETLGAAGSARIGRDLRISVSGNTGDLAAVVIGFGSGFVPLFGTTAVLLDPNRLFVVGSQVLGGSNWRFDVRIPNDANLVGLRLYSQALLVPTNGAPFTSNPRRTDLRD